MLLDLKDLTIAKAHEHLKNGDFSARELAETYLAKIEKENPELNAYLEVFSAEGGDGCLEQADEADKRIADGHGDTLTGIPLAIKDNIAIKGRTMTCGSRILEGYRATYDAGVIEKLKTQGAVLLGRTNMDEFAMGSSTEHSAFGATKNPHDLSRVPGGSSGGSAAALAGDLALGALGSETGGSVREPASFCGIVGLKPTYGALSRRGLVALASSLDQVGPFGKTVADTEILFNALEGEDAGDSTSYPSSLRKKESYAKALRPAATGLRIGVPRHLFENGGVDEDVLALFEHSLGALKENGYVVSDIELPNLKYSLPAYYVIMPAEASANLARFDGVRYGLRKEGANLLGDYEATRAEGFGVETRMRILLGTYVLSAGYHDAYYRRAVALRENLRKEVIDAWNSVDLIALPTAPTPAFKIGEKTEDPLSMYLADIFTVSANITGVPAISLPMGEVLREGKNLPVGFQFMAPHFGEKRLFEAGKDLERLL